MQHKPALLPLLASELIAGPTTLGFEAPERIKKSDRVSKLTYLFDADESKSKRRTKRTKRR